MGFRLASRPDTSSITVNNLMELSSKSLTFTPDLMIDEISIKKKMYASCVAFICMSMILGKMCLSVVP